MDFYVERRKGELVGGEWMFGRGGNVGENNCLRMVWGVEEHLSEVWL